MVVVVNGGCPSGRHTMALVAVVSFKSKGRQGRESSNRKFSSAADKIEEKEGTFHDVLNSRIG